ncbi:MULTISPECIES: sulfotransferase [Okeania]|uniref:Sulfotransferase n=1 Tax=Okeania hirsuta TaxID=1458930 RepID=A0A3N6NVV9_9CYAN|nr:MULTISPECIES: sulfotransferase [Okeania]NET12863.1 sulfotransferase [Okeania sp. SIO1H6]NES75052.1 sulfotransferase [Okeania sp. SIO1H4]NES92680.1 sulfotransferase [Okeania sp. SIO2B9]NET19367.1 sulfotransferase [Okeania sp. SIO1H5]NET75626.1 sulfotransferase [Okeania sp. SIO1F9]
MTLPNFILLGAAKSGTSSLWNYLKQHPQVFMSNPKEPNFFVFEGAKLPPYSGPESPEVLLKRLYQNTITDWESYQTLFDKVSNEMAIGEASVRYLYFPKAPENIKKYIPDVKMIVMLRHPVDRLYSHYVMNIRHLLEPLSLEEALEREAERISNNWGWDWHYTKVGMYSQQIKRYLNYFEPEQLKILFYDDFRQNPLEVIKEVYQYLGVDDSFVPNIERQKNQGYLPKNKLIHQFLSTSNPLKSFLKKVLPNSVYQKLIKTLKKWNSGAIPSLPLTLRKSLNEVFREDITELQEIVNRELFWLDT